MNERGDLMQISTHFHKLLIHLELFSFQKICDLRGWPAGSEKNTETHEVMFKIWEGLRSKADKDNDGQVGIKIMPLDLQPTLFLC